MFYVKMDMKNLLVQIYAESTEGFQSESVDCSLPLTPESLSPQSISPLRTTPSQAENVLTSFFLLPNLSFSLET